MTEIVTSVPDGDGGPITEEERQAWRAAVEATGRVEDL